MRAPAALFVLAAFVALGCSSPAAPATPVDAVDPFIGSGGKGFGVGSLTPAATVPWGMVKVGPDTTSASGAPFFAHCAGYWYEDDMILGFSQVHLVGTGAGDYGNVLMMPIDGMTAAKLSGDGYRSRFGHDSEEAAPGYYAVTLDDTGIRVELTATAHAAYHRYTFPAATADPVVLLDLGRMLDGRVASAHVAIEPAQAEVTGSLTAVGALSGRSGGVPIYFVARFTPPFVRQGTWAEGVLHDGATTEDADNPQDGVDLGAYLAFDSAGPVEARVAISFISVEQAQTNLLEDLPAGDFAATRQAAAKAWEDALAVIDIETDSEDDRTNFYTALYHLMQMPTLMTEAGGLYLGFDGEVHQAEGFTYHSDLSLWDTFRTFHPFVTLVLPDKERDFVISLVKMFEQGGAFPRWPMGVGDSGSMVGTSADIVIADSYLKGIRDGYDIESVYAGLRDHAVGPLPVDPGYGGREGIEDYLALGYVPADRLEGSVSITQEYSYDDFALAELAAALGKDADAARFAAQARSYRALWNPETRFFQGRAADGTFASDFDPLLMSSDYVEGNAWQYRFYAPHDVPGLIELFGGADALCAELETFFAAAADAPDTAMPDDYYWHGNEPDIHSAYVFALAGAPAETQQWVRWILDRKYHPAPDGLDGNDDGGTLSAWYLFSALGLYAIPGKDLYVIGSPIFPRAVLHLPGGDFVIAAPATSRTDLYVQSATLDGVPLEQLFLRHADIAGGGTLELVMGAAPSDWGAGVVGP